MQGVCEGEERDVKVGLYYAEKERKGMISTLHLLWIVPLAEVVGFMTAALLVAGKDESKGEDEL